ncbi:hypothetical protein BDP27DRAFT_1432525 [Rhodocollybia butyracea]|uniref:Uncharacterized protein n=1 Tax=Rhodocollybia butyracea TaxID=206335 RepID=A0A9P5TXB4_9AGAR|nr:hypothetical protein BDP27DRAFT_1432525 [Rhodocollybia butyracea]
MSSVWKRSKWNASHQVKAVALGPFTRFVCSECGEDKCIHDLVEEFPPCTWKTLSNFFNTRIHLTTLYFHQIDIEKSFFTFAASVSTPLHIHFQNCLVNDPDIRTAPSSLNIIELEFNSTRWYNTSWQMVHQGYTPHFSFLRRCTQLQVLSLEVTKRMMHMLYSKPNPHWITWPATLNIVTKRGSQWPTMLKKLTLIHDSGDSWIETKADVIFDVQLSFDKLESFSLVGYPLEFELYLYKTDFTPRVMNAARLELPFSVAQFLAGDSTVERLDLTQTWYNWGGNPKKLRENFPHRLPTVKEVAVRIPDFKDCETALWDFLGCFPNAKKLVLKSTESNRISAEMVYCLFQDHPLLCTLDATADNYQHDNLYLRGIRRALGNKCWSAGAQSLYFGGSLVWSREA